MNRKFEKQHPEFGTESNDDRNSHKAELRSQLQKNFKKKKNSRIGAMAVVSVACVVLLSTGQFTDVGSDSFSLFDSKNQEEDYYQVKTYFKDAGYGGSATGNETREEFRQQMEIVHEAKIAGDKKILGMTAWTISGTTCFIEEYEVKVPGGTKAMAGNVGSGKKMGNNEVMVMINHWKEFSADINSGKLKALPLVKHRVEGIEYTFKRWVKSIEGYGDVTYWESVPQ